MFGGIGLSFGMRRVILGWTLAAALAGMDIRTPRANALQPPIQGPSLVCFMHSRLHLGAGEQVTDFSAGIHAMTISVVGPRGRFSLSESNHFATPRRLGPTVYETKTLSIHRVRQDGQLRYAVVGFADFAPDEPRLLIWLSGPALAGGHNERVFRRIEVGDPAGASCDHGFRYGWRLED